MTLYTTLHRLAFRRDIASAALGYANETAESSQDKVRQLQSDRQTIRQALTSDPSAAELELAQNETAIAMAIAVREAARIEQSVAADDLRKAKAAFEAFHESLQTHPELIPEGIPDGL